MRKIIIGIDGGGTKTAYAAVDTATGRTVAMSSSDGIHIVADGERAVVAALRNGIGALQLQGDDAVVGVGIGDPAIDDSSDDPSVGGVTRRLVREAVGGVTHCFSQSDVFMALYAFTGGAPGALLVAGTGSMGVCLPQPFTHGGNNRLMTVGGWGYPRNDPGSGYAIAVQGVCAACDAFDGVGEDTALCDAVIKYFSISSPRALIDVLNGGVSRSVLAGFSRQVDACATAGDAVARAVLDEAGDALARYAGAMLCTGVCDVGIYGSVFLKSTIVRRRFEQSVTATFPDVHIAVPKHPPEYGAALFAADAMGIDRGGWI